MKKNKDIDSVFAEARKMLEDKRAYIKNDQVDYRNLYAETKEDIEKLEKESDEALLKGNIILADELAQRKNILRERANSLKALAGNMNNAKEELAQKYSLESSNFYHLVLASLKEADSEDLEEAQELIRRLFEISSRGEVRKQVAIDLINSWSNTVVPYARGESNIIFTRLSAINLELEHDRHCKEVATGTMSVFI